MCLLSVKERTMQTCYKSFYMAKIEALGFNDEEN